MLFSKLTLSEYEFYTFASLANIAEAADDGWGAPPTGQADDGWGTPPSKQAAAPWDEGQKQRKFQAPDTDTSQPLPAHHDQVGRLCVYSLCICCLMLG